MKRLFIVLAFTLVLPHFAFAQVEIEKKESKYDAFASKLGTVVTTHTYSLGNVELTSSYVETLKHELSFAMKKVIVGEASKTFLVLAHVGYKKSSLAMIEKTEVKALYNAISEMKLLKNEQVPEGARVEHTYLGNDGISISLDGNDWEIKLDNYTSDSITTKDIESFFNKLKEVIIKMDELK